MGHAFGDDACEGHGQPEQVLGHGHPQAQALRPPRLLSAPLHCPDSRFPYFSGRFGGRHKPRRQPQPQARSPGHPRVRRCWWRQGHPPPRNAAPRRAFLKGQLRTFESPGLPNCCQPLAVRPGSRWSTDDPLKAVGCCLGVFYDQMGSTPNALHCTCPLGPLQGCGAKFGLQNEGHERFFFCFP